MKQEQGRQQNEKTEISSSGIFYLNPEYEKRLHPHTLKRFNDWKAEIINEVPELEQLTIDKFNTDMNTYLNDEEKSRAVKYRDNVSKWLGKCIDIGNGYSHYSPVYDTSVISDMFGLKSLINKAYKARAERIEAERKEKEDSERWCAAYIAIKPPNDDANKYLDDEEFEKFERATWKAVDVYMEKREGYLDDIITFDYRQYLWKINYLKEWELREINHKKEKERQQNKAALAAMEFNNSLSKQIAESPNSVISQ
jgi:hypothetical protein